MKADHNTITPFDVKVMLKYKVLSKHECGVIKKIIWIRKKISSNYQNKSDFNFREKEISAN